MALKICHQQGREIDSCVARHVFTLDLLERFPEIRRNRVCIIGDGQANFVSLAMAKEFSDKLVSINLTEILLSDLELIERGRTITPEEITVARTKAEVNQFLQNPMQKLLLISAQNSFLLLNSQIDLFINIASFQEMTPYSR